MVTHPDIHADALLVSRLTPPGVTAIATIMVAGKGAESLMNQLFRPRGKSRLADTTRAHYGDFGIGITDDVVIRRLPNPSIPLVIQPAAQSSTPTDSATFEIHCHGGPSLVDALIEQVEQLGATHVSAEEFLAWQSGSLVHAEIAMALSQARTEKVAKLLLAQYAVLEPALSRAAKPEEKAWRAELRKRSKLGQHLLEPWRVVLFGPANVGKSHLLNSLAGIERAIVADQPGTTRDVLRCTISCDGWPIELIDGAGFRTTHDSLEQTGQQYLSDAMRQADLKVLIVDQSIPISETVRGLIADFQPDLIIGNKADLPSAWNESERAFVDLFVSATTRAGIDHLLNTIRQKLVPIEPSADDALPFSARQIALLSDATAIQ